MSVLRAQPTSGAHMITMTHWTVICKLMLPQRHLQPLAPLKTTVLPRLQLVVVDLTPVKSLILLSRQEASHRLEAPSNTNALKVVSVSSQWRISLCSVHLATTTQMVNLVVNLAQKAESAQS